MIFLLVMNDLGVGDVRHQ